uniref:Uncharacterized protein n=1 Tax=Sipha flava TaxID=143950 RepID=A0A2S2QJZ4_9HEMI
MKIVANRSARGQSRHRIRQLVPKLVELGDERFVHTVGTGTCIPNVAAVYIVAPPSVRGAVLEVPCSSSVVAVAARPKASRHPTGRRCTAVGTRSPTAEVRATYFSAGESPRRVVASRRVAASRCPTARDTAAGARSPALPEEHKSRTARAMYSSAGEPPASVVTSRVAASRFPTAGARYSVPPKKHKLRAVRATCDLPREPRAPCAWSWAAASHDSTARDTAAVGPHCPAAPEQDRIGTVRDGDTYASARRPRRRVARADTVPVGARCPAAPHEQNRIGTARDDTYASARGPTRTPPSARSNVAAPRQQVAGDRGPEWCGPFATRVAAPVASQDWTACPCPTCPEPG